MNERERTGGFGLGASYARRARRILPAAVLVLAVTLLAARFVVSPLDLRRIADDGLAASLSLANMRFAFDATDYFAPVDASPMLHLSRASGVRDSRWPPSRPRSSPARSSCASR